ncbi:hypothetical protein UPYG_G00329420 [Umbra pygmaea]|uniref:Kinesin motor domain-containing protein n=1 Tax=Umbra pygmaea TaxID=75934 RepID=A0ABD0W1R6_UMBPY
MATMRVAVRVRPLNNREKEMSAAVIVHMEGRTTSIDCNKKHTYKGIPGVGLNDGGTHSFSYDFSYNSTDTRSPYFVPQEKVFEDLGSDVIKAAFEGYNACVFAYGQTGSGKSYTMIGTQGDMGLIPRICEGLFCQISKASKNEGASFRTEVSYLEIYNERVQDLLMPMRCSENVPGLRVREHPKDGPYVQDLSKHLVQSYSEVEDLMHAGNCKRTTAQTGMNDSSSRSHAIFTVNFTQARFDAELPCETVSKIHLVDLAGSERANATGANGARLKEGANINKSLVTLGNVISALAEVSMSVGSGDDSRSAGKRKKLLFIPYRDSLLTWLLKDSLGGNAKTMMIATISPADVNYSETMSTLRYANRAKNIINTPKVNEDSSVRVIRELQEEIARLRRLVDKSYQVPRSPQDLSKTLKVEEKLHKNEAKVLELTKEWTNKWGESHNILKEETVALRKEGLGVVLDSQLPHLIGIDADLLSTGLILYHLKEGKTLVGRHEAPSNQDIVLHGDDLLDEHCVFENRGGAVTLLPQMGALCSVNGTETTQPCQLTHGAVLRLGSGTVFRFNQPSEAAQLREKRKSMSMSDLTRSAENPAKVMLFYPGVNGCEAGENGDTTPHKIPVEKWMREDIPTKAPFSHRPSAGISGALVPVQVGVVADPCLRAGVKTRHRAELEGPSSAANEENQGSMQNGVSEGGREGALPFYGRRDEQGPCWVEEEQSRTRDMAGNQALQLTPVLPVQSADGCTVGPLRMQAPANESPGDLSHLLDGLGTLGGDKSHLTFDGRVRHGDASRDTGPAGTSLGAAVPELLRGDGGSEEAVHLLPEAIRRSSSIYTQTSPSRFRAHPRSQVEHVSPRLDRHRRSQAVHLPLDLLEGQFSRGVMDRSRTMVEACGENREQESQAEARKEGWVEQGFVLGAMVTRVSREEPEEVRNHGVVFRVGALATRVSQISGLGGEQGSVSGMGSLVTRGVSWMFPDAGRLIRNSTPQVLQQVWDSAGRLQTVGGVDVPQPGVRGGAGGLQAGVADGAGSSWSSQVVSMVMESQALSVVKDSQVFSLVRESHVYSLVRHSEVFCKISNLPLVRHIRTELTQDFQNIPRPLNQDCQLVEVTGNQQTVLDLNTTPDSLQVHSAVRSLYPNQDAAVEGVDVPPKQNVGDRVAWRKIEPVVTEPVCPEEQVVIGGGAPAEPGSVSKVVTWSAKNLQDYLPKSVKNGARSIQCQVAPEHGVKTRPSDPEKTSVPWQEGQRAEGVLVIYQRLVAYPGSLVTLQGLPVPTLLGCLQSVLPPNVLTSQRLVALYWLGVANCSRPRPHSALILLLESCLYAVTLDPEQPTMPDEAPPLTVFHHLPLLQIKEIQVGFCGQSLRLTASSHESILTLYTHSQTLTQSLTRTLLGVLRPGDQRVAKHTLLVQDVMRLSLDWKTQVPDLLMDAGLKLSCPFHKTLAALVYIVHGNMEGEKPCMGEVRFLLYTSVGVTTTPEPRPDAWAQLFLTDTHLGLVQEDAVFHPNPRHVALLPPLPQFQGVSLRCRSDVRCVMVRDGTASSVGVGGNGPGLPTRVDVIFSRAWRTRREKGGRLGGHPEWGTASWADGSGVVGVAGATVPPADFNSSRPPSQRQQAGVWKLTFSCSSEASCLINHLSNV